MNRLNNYISYIMCDIIPNHNLIAVKSVLDKPPSSRGGFLFWNCKMKKCSTCKVEKPYTDFYKHKSMKDGYGCQCRECRKIYLIKNTIRIKQWSNQYYIDNKDRKKQIDREYGKKYRQSEHGKLVRKSSWHRRRALLKANTPSGKHFTPADIILKLKLQHEKCIYCEISIKSYYEIDHIIPLSKGGSNETYNIQLLCEKCNGTGGKGWKLPHEFAQQHGKLF